MRPFTPKDCVRRLRACALLTLLAATACDPLSLFGPGFDGDPRLDTHWATVRSDSFHIGHTILDEQAAGTTGRVFVPAHYKPGTPIGLLVMLHGAGGVGAYYVSLFQHLADSADFIILAPESWARTWDMLSTRRLGTDVRRLSRSIEYVLERATIDPARIWLGGHSDGASYAITIGTANGDHFTRLLIFAAGIYYSPMKTGRPPVRVMHGYWDEVLAFSQVQHNVVRPLKNARYPVTFAPYYGGHLVPAAVADSAIAWLQQP
jgi:predicted esterase